MKSFESGGLRYAILGWAAMLWLVFMGPGCSRSQAVRIDGSSTVYPITEAAAEAFREEAPEIRVTVGVSGTGGGFKKFQTGQIDICNASREMKAPEKKACQEAGIQFFRLEVAYDGLAVVVHPQNDWCDVLTVQQLRKLWRPESNVQRWNQLDPAWPDREITLYGPGTDSGTFDYFTEVIVGKSKASRSDFTASEDDNVLVRGVTGDRYALAYFGYAYYSENQDDLKLLGIDAGEGPVRPSIETVREGTYAPLSRPLFLYVRKQSATRSDVARFLRFYLDHAAQLSEKVGYVPVSDEAMSQNKQQLEAATGGTDSA